MNNEKMKEIKKALEYMAKNKYDRFAYNCEDKEKFGVILYADILTLINELESKNERLRLERDVLIGKKIVEKQKSDKALIMKIDIQEQLKDRIAELEEALLDMVVQFCQMSKEGYLHHTFMSAEENAFDVLDIEYGEKVDDVYKRFNEKWERNN